MSWKDKLENGIFKITTGDGKVFTPLWKPGETSLEFNTSAYSFIGLKGTLVDRKQAQSSKYPLTFWFQGADNIEQTDAFFKASEDPRAWEVEHPLYGLINGQPLSISRNDVNINVTQVTVDFWESISVDYPDDAISVRDRIQAKSFDVQLAGIRSLSSITPNTSDISVMKTALNQTQGSFLKIVGDKKVEYTNAATGAIKATEKYVTSKVDAIKKIQQLFSLPLGFVTSIKNKVKTYEAVIASLSGLIDSKNDKHFYESQGAGAIASLCECAVNPLPEDYITRSEIESVVESIIKIYSSYLEVLDANQVGQYEIEKTWNPDVNLQAELIEVVVDTIANLQVLAFEVKQERIVYTDKTTNLILLTHRYLGMDAADENIERFRKINNIKNDELFLIPKGRKIKYFA